MAQDVRIALKSPMFASSGGDSNGQPQRGKTSSMDLPRGWLTVREAMRLPLPDTSWMDHAIPRHAFTKWLNEDKGRP